MTRLAYVPNRIIDHNGIADGATVHVYLTGTTTPVNLYSNSAMTTPMANPFTVAAGASFPAVYYDSSVNIKLTIVSAADGSIEEYDPYSPLYLDTIYLTLPPFNNTAYYSGVKYLLNGATPGSWYSTGFSGNNATEALTSGVIVPVTATNIQTNSIAAYLRSDRASVGGGGEVGLFSYVISNATNGNVFPINTVANDTIGKTGQTLSNELDFNVNVPATTVNGINAVIVSTLDAALTGSRIAYAARGAFHTTSQWSHGYYTADGAIEVYAAFYGAQTAVAGTDRDSQKIALTSYNSANTRYIATLFGDHLGGMAFRVGGPGAFGFQDSAGSANWFSVDSTGANLPTGKVLSVNSVQVVGPRNTGWAADTGTAKKTANATYTAGTTLTYSAAYVQAEQTAMATRVAALEAVIQNNSQTIKAMKDAMIAHGLIGA